MNYRQLGRTGLMVSEIGLGGEWLERHNTEEVAAIVKRSEELGINILDCFMSEPKVRTNIGLAIAGHREKWYIQGHIGSAWEDGQYIRTRDVEKCKVAFTDLLERLQTDYIDLGMIHFIDEEADWNLAMNGPFIEYVKELKATGKVHHIGISTHNTRIARKSAESGFIDVILFSLNPAYDLLPATENIDEFFAEEYDASLSGIDAERAELYKICETNGVAITVMKGYGGSRLLDAKRSPFGVALTPVQCLHYALTRPAVASVLVGYNEPAHVDAAVAYETASEEEKDYASVLAGAPRHAYDGQCTYCGHCKPCPMNIDIAMVNKLYDLATTQPEIPATVKEHYEGLGATAADCIACGACEDRCPLHVSIIDRMEKARDLFG